MTTEKPMQLGMIGLGRMGANLVRRLIRDGHRCVVYNRSPGRIEELQSEGAEGAFTLRELIAKLKTTRGVDHGPGRRRGLHLGPAQLTSRTRRHRH